MNNSSRNDNLIPFLQSEQVYLTEIDVTHVEGNYITWLDDPEITQYLETRFFPTSVEEAKEYLKSTLNNDDVLLLAIMYKGNDEHIGNVKLGPINWIHRRAEIGILIGEKEYWGRGIATECIQEITEYAFETLNLHKLTAGCYENNVGSIKAFKKAGFNEEGRRIQHAHCNGEYTDVIKLGLVRVESEV